VEVVLHNRGHGLGLRVDCLQDPVNPTRTVIVIAGLVPGGVAQVDDRLQEGDRLLFVNDINLENISWEFAVEALDNAGLGRVRIRIAKPLPRPDACKNSADNRGWSVLHSAAHQGQAKTVIELLERGVDVNTATEEGWTALHAAANQGHAHIVAELVRRGANVNAMKQTGWTALHAASNQQHVHVVTELIRSGADVNAVYQNGSTALYIASSYGHTYMVSLLLENGADVDRNCKENYTPLHIAAQKGFTDVVTLLLKYNASTSALTSSGKTPLVLARQHGFKSVAVILKDTAEDQAVGYCITDSALEQHIRQMKLKMEEMECTMNCAICYENQRNVAYLCGHSACAQCSRPLRVCHMCRKPITKKIKLFT